MEESGKPKTDSPKIVLWAAIMASGTLLSRVLGLIRDMLIAAIFPRLISDAWTVAFRLPNLFRRLLGEGSLAVSFIPVFVRIQHQKGEYHEDAKQLVASLFTLLSLILTVLSVFCVAWMDPIIRHLVSGEGYTSVAGKLELTVQMARIMFPFIFLMSLYAYFMAILNSFKKFAYGAFAPALLNIALIVAALIPESDINQKAMYQSWAVIVGGFLQMSFLIPQLYRLGYFPKIRFQFNTPPMRQIFAAMLPSMMGMSIVQITGVVNVYFASQLPQGTHSYIYFADRVLELPLTLFAVSLGSALLPTLSKYWAAGERDKMLDTTSKNLRLILFLALPCSAGFYFLARPIVEVLFMRGQFDSNDVAVTADILRVYSLTVITASGVRILAPSFYAISNTWLPASISGLSLILHVIMAPTLIAKWGVIGIPGSTVLSAAFNLLLLYLSHYIFIGRLATIDLVTSVVKYLLCSLTIVFAIKWLEPFYNTQTNVFGRCLFLALIIGAAILFYMISAFFLRVPETKQVAAIFKAKLRKRRTA